MRRDIERRLAALEVRTLDHISRLPTVDYLGVTKYDDGEWDEVYFDSTVTVVRHKSGEIRGYYRNRLSEEVLIEAGGDLAYL